jgi:outer membrane protein TolC
VLEQRSDVLKLTHGCFDAGLDTQVEVKQAESALAAAQVELTQIETTTAQLCNQVAALSGAGPQRGHEIKPAQLTTPPCVCA